LKLERYFFDLIIVTNKMKYYDHEKYVFVLFKAVDNSKRVTFMTIQLLRTVNIRKNINSIHKKLD